ncbi:MAG: Hint domain-containing protein [Elioraea tepidiphila]
MPTYEWTVIWTVTLGPNNTITLDVAEPPPGSNVPAPPLVLLDENEQPVEGPLVIDETYYLYDLDGNSGTVIYLGITPNGDLVFKGAFSDDYMLVTDATTYSEGDTFTFGDVICFLAGTRIATPSGEVPVEALRPGDPVLTADGRSVPVRFVGRQTVDARFADAVRGIPVRIRAGALDEAVPRRDLFVSPNHAIAIDGILALASALRNGVTIADAPPPAERFTWYSIETATQEVILAEGCPAETFVDNVPRQRWDNWRDYVALYGEEPVIEELPLPKAQSARQVPRRVRARIAARLAALTGAEAAAA